MYFGEKCYFLLSWTLNWRNISIPTSQVLALHLQAFRSIRLCSVYIYISSYSYIFIEGFDISGDSEHIFMLLVVKYWKLVLKKMRKFQFIS